MMGATDWQSAGARIGDYVTERNLAAKPGFVACSAKHALLPRRARISTVHPAFAGSQAIAAQLVREACILEVLRHAGVPRVFECGELDDGRPWVACELVEGPSLALLLAEEGKLEVPMVLALLAGVAEILHYAHTRGLVHRNLRPEAIASRPEGPCIVDWSDARARESEALQLAPLDWLAYQPPEVIGGEPADSRADVFALGVIAYEALAGAKPSGTGATARRFPAVPIRLLALIDRMLAPDALVRPTSAEVRAEALAIVEQIEVPVPPPADEDGPDVQIVDVELESELADADLDGWGAPPPPPPLATSAPTIVMPEMAFDPDIKGVCSVGGIFAIISKPTNTDRTKIVTETMKASKAAILPAVRAPLRLPGAPPGLRAPQEFLSRSHLRG
jgi:serine/threonine protein kinase